MQPDTSVTGTYTTVSIAFHALHKLNSVVYAQVVYLCTIISTPSLFLEGKVVNWHINNRNRF